MTGLGRPDGPEDLPEVALLSESVRWHLSIKAQGWIDEEMVRALLLLKLVGVYEWHQQVRCFLKSTDERLKLFYLPLYMPDLPLDSKARL